MLMDSDGAFHFLETNTRLQVEHGVTEAITGIDLVEAQLRIAAGAGLDEVLPHRVGISGHALELRVYAEDPDRFLPSTGTLECFRVPRGEGVRVDSALETGAAVTPFYDPMLALVIVHGADRDDAIARALTALDDFEVRGVKTNIEFLRRVLQSPAFREARHHVDLATQPGALT
jgi:acetyl-CoA carboxylase biotin carboxylase subunit